MTSRKECHISWRLSLTLAVLCFLLSLAGVLCLLFSARGVTHDIFALSDTAAPIRDVNGLAQDEEGNYYIGCGGSSSIQVFDRDGKFLRRFCVPTYKAGSASFAWKLEGETLRVYTYRGLACLTVKGTEVIKTETYPGSDALRAAMEADGLSPYGGGHSGTGADGALLRLNLLGRLRVTESDGTHRTLSLEAPRFPPPFPLCWGMTLVGIIGMLLLLGRAAGSLSGLGGKKRREGLDNSRHIR